jgi:hypothetical protein
MGAVCCIDRDKPPEDKEKPRVSISHADPPTGFLTRKPKDNLKLILLMGSDSSLLSRLLDMMSSEYQTEAHDKGVYLLVEEWKFDIRTALTTDVSKFTSEANQAKVVFFFFDLKDSRALMDTHDVATTFKAATRAESQKYLVGYNSAISDNAAQEAGEAAADLGFMYFEIPFPRPSGRQLIERMKK